MNDENIKIQSEYVLDYINECISIIYSNMITNLDYIKRNPILNEKCNEIVNELKNLIEPTAMIHNESQSEEIVMEEYKLWKKLEEIIKDVENICENYRKLRFNLDVVKYYNLSLIIKNSKFEV